jgi:hypothetical protein
MASGIHISTRNCFLVPGMHPKAAWNKEGKGAE